MPATLAEDAATTILLVAILGVGPANAVALEPALPALTCVDGEHPVNGGTRGNVAGQRSARTCDERKEGPTHVGRLSTITVLQGVACDHHTCPLGAIELTP